MQNKKLFVLLCYPNTDSGRYRSILAVFLCLIFICDTVETRCRSSRNCLNTISPVWVWITEMTAPCFAVFINIQIKTMNELIKITTNEQGLKVVSARELYELLGYDKSQWKRWATKNIEENPFAIETQDWVGFDIVSSSNNGSMTKDYALSIDFSKRLSQMARTAKGEEIRNYFIECEKQLSQPKELTKKEILLLALESEERALAAESKVLELQPKVEAFDRVIDNSSSLERD